MRTIYLDGKRSAINYSTQTFLFLTEQRRHNQNDYDVMFQSIIFAELWNVLAFLSVCFALKACIYF